MRHRAKNRVTRRAAARCAACAKNIQTRKVKMGGCSHFRPASTHTALVSSPSLAVLHLSTYLQGCQVRANGAVHASHNRERDALCMVGHKRKRVLCLLFTIVFFFIAPYDDKKQKQGSRPQMTCEC